MLSLVSAQLILFILFFYDSIQMIVVSSALDDKAQNLRSLSDKYKKNANKLNMQSTFARVGIIVLIIIIILFVLKYYLF